jgi:hypothetical protein
MNNTRTLRSNLVSSRLFVVAALVVLFTTTVFASSTPAATFDRTLTVSGPVDLEVLTHSGDVTVRAGASGTVTIHGKIFMSDRWNILPGVGVGGNRDSAQAVAQNPPIRQEGNSVHIDYVEVKNISVDYEITVPADTTIRSHSGSGDQLVEGTHGNVDVTTGSGDVKLSNLTGQVTLQTGSGDVRAREISGPVKGGTGSGNVEVEETGAGDITLRTGSGNITARGVQGGFRGETGSGDVTAEGTQSGSWEIHTGSGNVHVQLPSNAAFDADISTSSGTVDVESPIEMTVQGRVGDTHKQIRGKVRGGGPLLRVHTGSGDIHIA